MWITGIGVWLAILGSLANSAQDKYTVKVPGGLSFSDFRGYEAWQAISISRNESVVALILGNPVRIRAYPAGIPGNEAERVLQGSDGARQAFERGLHGERQQEVR